MAVGIGCVLPLVPLAGSAASSDNPVGPFWGRPYPYGYAYNVRRLPPGRECAEAWRDNHSIVSEPVCEDALRTRY